MADEEKLVQDIFDGIFRDVLEEKLDDPVQKTKNLLSFMLSGKEPFNAVVSGLRLIKGVHFATVTEEDDKYQVDCHIGMFDDDHHFRDLPDILMGFLLRFANSLILCHNTKGVEKYLTCLEDNKRLKSIIFGEGCEGIQSVLSHVKHVDEIAGFTETFQAIVELKVDVSSVVVKELSKYSCCNVLRDLFVDDVSPQFTGLKELTIVCNVGDKTVVRALLPCMFDRYMIQFETLALHYEESFPELEKLYFHVAVDAADFFERIPVNYAGLDEQISFVQEGLENYSGRLKIAFFCFLDYYEQGHIATMETWTTRNKRHFTGFAYNEKETQYRSVREWSKVYAVKPEVSLMLTVRCFDDNDGTAVVPGVEVLV